MSVINQMLRDLDARKASSLKEQQITGVKAVTARLPGVQVSVAPLMKRPGPWLLIALFTLIVVVGVVAGLLRPDTGAAPAVFATAKPSDQAATTISPSASASAAKTEPGPDPRPVTKPLPGVAATPASPALADTLSGSAAVAGGGDRRTAIPVSPPVMALKAPVPPVPPVPPVTAARVQALEAQVPLKPVMPPISALPSGRVAATTVAPVTVTSAVTGDAMPAMLGATAPAEAPTAASSDARLKLALMLEENAQRPRAIAVLREGLTNEGDDFSVILRTALARMELSERKPEVALDLLRPLVPRGVLGVEGWALIANAAQRVSSHAEAVEAYRQALKTRPRESRWLAGAAISLLASGRREEALQMAQSARSTGALDAEVASYLERIGL